MSGDQQVTALLHVPVKQLDFSIRKNACMGKADHGKLLKRFQTKILVKNKPKPQVLVCASLVGPLNAFEIIRGLISTDPVPSGGAEIDADIAQRRMTKMRALAARFPQQRSDAIISYRIEPTIVCGLIDHGHEGAMRQQREHLPAHVVQGPSRLIMIHAAPASAQPPRKTADCHGS